MEQETLNNDKSVLLENTKAVLAKQAKKNNISFLIFCLLMAILLVCIMVKRYDLVVQLIYTVMYAAFVFIGFHITSWVGKMVKAADVNELLSVYDKNIRIDKTITTVFIVIAAILLLFLVFKDMTEYTLFLIAALAFSSHMGGVRKISGEIEKLRDAEQQKD